MSGKRSLGNMAIVTTRRIQSENIDIKNDCVIFQRRQTLDTMVRQTQMAAIRNALEQSGGNTSKAAALLGKDRGNLYRLMKKVGMKTVVRIKKGK